MNIYGYGSVLRPVFDCLRVQTEQLFARSGVAALFALGEYRSTRPAVKKPAPCCEQNWLIPSVRANSSSRTASLVRRMESAEQNSLPLSACNSRGVSSCLANKGESLNWIKELRKV